MPDSLWEDKSPTVFLIKSSHETAQLDSWDKRRFIRLTKLWNVTPYELSAMAGIYSPLAAQKAYQNERWSRPVCLHFCRLEILAHQLKLGSEQVDPEIGLLAKLAARKESNGRSGDSRSNGEHTAKAEGDIQLQPTGSQ